MIRRIIYFAVISIVLISCGGEYNRVALSYAEVESTYGRWLKSVDENVKLISLKGCSPEEAIEILATCDGVVFTGGADVSPAKYGKAFDSVRCKIDYKRDSLEFKLITKSMDMKIPILGVCRGEQILNVAMGGSLIVDIPEDIGPKVTHRKKGGLVVHRVSIDTTSVLYRISNGVSSSVVNSYHHQAVDVLADCFKASAYSADGVIEAIEWKDPVGKPFLVAVQWHPERLGKTNKLSYSIVKEFMKSMKK